MCLGDLDFLRRKDPAIIEKDFLTLRDIFAATIWLSGRRGRRRGDRANGLGKPHDQAVCKRCRLNG